MPRRASKNLFAEEEPAVESDKALAPLAERMRPRTLAEFVGQSHLVGEGRILRRLIEGKEARAAIAAAAENKKRGQRTVLFIDEIHRFNKAQQDALLHAVENGTVTLIGATTENPSFEVTGALLSRCRVLVLNPLTEDDIGTIIRRALGDAGRGLADLRPALSEEQIGRLARASAGDARVALAALE